MAAKHIYHGQGNDSYMTLESGHELHYLLDEAGLTREFAAWLDQAEPFRFVSKDVTLRDITIRPEDRKGKRYWYGYLREKGKLHKQYVGQDSDLTASNLETVAIKLNYPGIWKKQREPEKVTQPRIDRTELAEMIGKLQQVHSSPRNNFSRERKKVLQQVITRLVELGRFEE